MHALKLLTHHIDLQQYPEYSRTERTSEVPGFILLEQYATRGVRIAVPLFMLATTGYFYLFLRPSLPFADRPLVRLHHFVYPSAGYATPVGFVAGVAHGVAQFEAENSASQLEVLLQQQEAGAKREVELRRRRRAAVVDRVRANQSALSRLSVRLGIEEDPVNAALARTGLAHDISWEAFLAPYSLAWVAASSRGWPSHASRESTAGSDISKLEVDNVVSQAMQYRRDPDNDRWTKSAGRFSTAGACACLLFWRSGGRAFRASMGMGLGALGGSMISALKVDDLLTHVG